MKMELKKVLDAGYELALRDGENLYNSEHLLLAILQGNSKVTGNLSRKGITFQTVQNCMQKISNSIPNDHMHEHQKMQVSEFMRKVIKNDNTVQDVLDRIAREDCTARYVARCINSNAFADESPSAVNKTKRTSSTDLAITGLKEFLTSNVIGQNEAIESVVKVLKRRCAGISGKNRPIGTMFFVGRTGVGKTELAKLVARRAFSGNLVRIDMSEYQEKVSVAKLIGSAPGYVGYDQGGILTEAVKKKPQSIVLFDEVEKAHPEVFNVFLQMLDEGRLTDNKGVTVDFSNTLIIFTSNIGAERCGNAAQYRNELRNYFKPEFLNRLSDIVVFNALTIEDLKTIAEKEIEALAKNLKANRNITLKADNAVIDHAVSSYGLNAEYGAREVTRVVVSKIEDIISDAIIEGRLKDNSTATVTMKNGVIEVC